MSEQGEAPETKKPKREKRMGKSTGFATNGDEWWVAPVYKDEWTELDADERALALMAESHNNYLQRSFKSLERCRLDWWDRIYEDLGLDREVKYSFNRLEGKIFLAPETSDEATT